MNRFLSCILLLLLCALHSRAGDKFEMSTAVGLKEVGINKVLCMKDGNTVLFHFENGKPIKVFIYDSTHTRVATTRHECQVLDIFMLSTTKFKGLYEINKEAVLFFEQQDGGRHSLIRVRFNAHNGKLIDEERIGRSSGLAKPTQFFVMKHDQEAGYAILYSQDVRQFRECKIHVSYYNAHHEVYKDIPINVNRKKYDYLMVAGAESQPQGICLSFGLSNMLVNGTGNTVQSTPLYQHFLNVFYIPKDSTTAMQRTIDLTTELTPAYTHFTHNPFAGTINLQMLSFKDVIFRYGIDLRPVAFVANILFRFDETNLDGGYAWVANRLANKELAEKTDTANKFSGLPVSFFTNVNGLSTLVSQSYTRFINTETHSRSEVFETFLGHLCITQSDDVGREIWGTVLPLSQYYKSYRHYYRPADLARKWQEQAMFNDLPPQVFNRQFFSVNVQKSGDNFYIMFNDGSKNFNNSIENPGDTVFDFALSNACYYKINKKKEVSKHYLLGTPLDNEYKSSFIEGADFDRRRKTYATLVRYKRGEYVSLRMAWVPLD